MALATADLGGGAGKWFVPHSRGLQRPLVAVVVVVVVAVGVVVVVVVEASIVVVGP